MEGDLYRGSHYRAGEFGVLPVGNNGEPMHDVASASGLMKACRRALAVSEEEMPDGESCLNAWRATHLREAIEEWAHCLSRGVYSVISMFDPQAVLIGGGVSEQEKIYLLLDKYLQRFEEWEALKVPILPCELGNRAGGWARYGWLSRNSPAARSAQGNSCASRSRWSLPRRRVKPMRLKYSQIWIASLRPTFSRSRKSAAQVEPRA